MKGMEDFDRWTTWPEWAHDALVVDTHVRLNWRDWLRVVVQRRCSVSTKTFTEHVVGRTSTVANFTAPPLIPRRSHGMVSTDGR